MNVEMSVLPAVFEMSSVYRLRFAYVIWLKSIFFVTAEHCSMCGRCKPSNELMGRNEGRDPPSVPISMCQAQRSEGCNGKCVVHES